MKRIILASMLLTVTVAGTHAFDGYQQRQALRAAADVVQGAIWIASNARHSENEHGSDVQAVVARTLPTSEWLTAIGDYAGAIHGASRDLLLGDYADAPDDRPGFVNFGNRLCFWRDTGSVVSCPTQHEVHQ